jgi:DNA-directed RNA polymerase beta subunit
MIPFSNHDDANRALMGSNMQKQATLVFVQKHHSWRLVLKSMLLATQDDSLLLKKQECC